MAQVSLPGNLLMRRRRHLSRPPCWRSADRLLPRTKVPFHFQDDSQPLCPPHLANLLNAIDLCQHMGSHARIALPPVSSATPLCLYPSRRQQYNHRLGFRLRPLTFPSANQGGSSIAKGLLWIEPTHIDLPQLIAVQVHREKPQSVAFHKKHGENPLPIASHAW